MTAVSALTRTLVGKKVVMAVTGMLLLGYLVAHMLGNLKVFGGPAALNAYAEGLRTVGQPFLGHGQLLWLVRLVLLPALLLHIWAAAAVTRASWRARPVSYHRLAPDATTYAARTMRWGGVIIALYVVFHVLDLTLGTVHPAFQPGEVYANLVASFQRPAVAAAYIGANLVVGLHVYHGLWSATQTLGLKRRRTESWRRGLAGLAAGALTAGYVVVPLAVWLGWIA